MAVRCPRRGTSKEVRGPLGSRADRPGRNPVAQCAGTAAQVGCRGSASTAPAQTQGPEEAGDDSSSPFPGRYWPSHRQDAGMCKPHAEQPPVRASPSTPNGHQRQRAGQGPLAGPSAPPQHTQPSLHRGPRTSGLRAQPSSCRFRGTQRGHQCPPASHPTGPPCTGADSEQSWGTSPLRASPF